MYSQYVARVQLARGGTIDQATGGLPYLLSHRTLHHVPYSLAGEESGQECSDLGVSRLQM